MTDQEAVLQTMRRRAPADLDFEALLVKCQRRNAELVEAWRRQHPNADAALLKVVTKISGQARRRLRRYREFAGPAQNTPGELVIRLPAQFEWLDVQVTALCVAAARGGAASIDWSLITVQEALADWSP